MPHIAVTMLPGRDRETKQKLAENLCNTLIETLGVDAKFVSVSVEDVEMKEWENSNATHSGRNNHCKSQ